VVQRIGFCITSDGVRIAYSVAGEGPPLVQSADWFTHLELEWQSPVWGHLFDALAARHTLIRYDMRGTGLSDRDVEDISFEHWVTDLRSVVDALGLREFALLGRGPTAIEYALRHPERVSALVLYGSFAHLSISENTQQIIPGAMRLGWARDNPAYRQLFTSLVLPEAEVEQTRWPNEFQRVSVSPQMAARIFEEMCRIDVSDSLSALRIPTMIIHRRGDSAVYFESGRELAAHIPDARFIPLEGKNHWILAQEPEFKTFLETMEQFLSEALVKRPRPEGLTSREVEVLRLIAGGRTNREIAAELVLSPRTVGRHVTNLYGKIGARGKADATAYALQHELT
jgi:pimeloyl-ACP methyl ester carboxylesterase/DNA-binding CsgD family transcriptional regulator